MNQLINKSNAKIQGLALAIVLLFSIGQSMAFYNSCEMDSSDHSVHQNVEHVSMAVDSDPGSMMVVSDSSMQNMDDDCCQNNCMCPQSACSSANLISYAPSKLLFYSDSHSELMAKNSITLDYFSNSLYRPPISC
ncbi:hypothetical protein [Marinicella rhabdoformis]|uniref:hypothetical protein n=1 Tax=Marinicella rhabdoformis TaxID=2580566 RepID=UPI0015CFC72D|nr:hypothetical protein [Marinicella rhabdoformis]